MSVHQPVHPTYLPQDPLGSEPITISGQATNQPTSPLLKVEDCSKVFGQDTNDWEAKNGSCAVNQLSQSPERIGYHRNRDSRSDSLSVSPPCISPSLSEDDLGIHKCPSSPLLVAMRDAVDSLNKYEDFKILEKIGAGFFADVYKVQHLPTDQVMVLKINKKMNGLKKLKEVELLKKLQHPNILHYVGACVHEGQLHPLTEYMNGGALEQLIQNKNIEFPWSLRLNLSLDIAKGMEYLHRNGMFHRDLNSKNVLLRKQGSNYTAVVADFGLAAKTPGLLKNMRRQQSVVGNPYWMAPEVLRGKPYNEKADVFSYGIVLCEIITRLDADPDELRRTRDYGMDETFVRSQPEAEDCPMEFTDLSFQCCRILPIERPTFTEAKARILVVIDRHQQASLEETIQPMPSSRLSYHEAHTTGIDGIDGRPRSRSYSPPGIETEVARVQRKMSKETPV